MNYHMILNIIGRIMCVEGAFMLPALCIAVGYGEALATNGFAIAILMLFALGFPLSFWNPVRRGFYVREGLVSVGLVWIVVSLFGAVPYYLCGGFESLVDCFFESVSGFTTTGATILSDIEAMPRSILYWRCFTQWLGGMGVLVFLLIMGPLTKNSGDSMHLLRAESPGPSVGKLVPRIQQSATILYLIYIVMTLIELVLLLLGGAPLFDAVTIAASTGGTGGFGIKNDSLASYSPYIQNVVTVFMLLFGVNFNLIYFALLREWRKVLKNEELRVYLLAIIAAALLIAGNTFELIGSFGEALRQSSFQVVSIITSSGYTITDFNLWPELSRTLVVLLMIMGGCAGSTSGGLKVVRILLLAKSAARSVYTTLRPNSARLIHMDGELVENERINSLHGYMMTYLLIFFAVLLLLSLNGLSFETNFTATLSCINNIGPGLGAIGPSGGFGGFSGFSKLLLSLTMLAGRLEIFPMLALFVPSVWRK